MWFDGKCKPTTIHLVLLFASSNNPGFILVLLAVYSIYIYTRIHILIKRDLNVFGLHLPSFTQEYFNEIFLETICSASAHETVLPHGSRVECFDGDRQRNTALNASSVYRPYFQFLLKSLVLYASSSKALSVTVTPAFILNDQHIDIFEKVTPFGGASHKK